MNRLITFGCSLTYGSALENPNDAWPNQLASKWNLDLVNVYLEYLLKGFGGK